MLLKRLKKEMSLKEIEQENDEVVRLNKLHWFLKRKLIIGTIISIITFLFAILIKAGAYTILSTQMPIFQILVIIYGILSIVLLLLTFIIREIKAEKEKHFYRLAYIYDLYNFFMECICVLLLLMTYLFAFVRVSGPSMKPTYRSNDILACRSIGYKPKNNDIVIVYMKNIDNEYAYNVSNYRENALYIKRIVATPGDTITYDTINKTISVNDVVIEEKYGDRWKLKTNTITLKDNEYFIMGDNRGDSTDSRYFGPVTRKDIVGKALFNLLFWR